MYEKQGYLASVFKTPVSNWSFNQGLSVKRIVATDGELALVIRRKEGEGWENKLFLKEKNV
jgi:hypothetical protein